MLEVKEYLDKTVAAIKADALSKNQRIPEMKVVETPTGGQVWSAGYLWYLVFGRGPGKFPPPEAMLKSVKDHPEWLQQARLTYKGVTERSLAYMIGRKIAKKGTDIFLHKRPGLDILGAMELNMPELTKKIARNEGIKILTFLKSGLMILIFCTSCIIAKPIARQEADTTVVDYGYYKEQIIRNPEQQPTTKTNWLFVGAFVIGGILLWQP